MSRLAVIYLRTSEAFYDSFIASYLAHTNGHSHTLWIAWKSKQTQLTSYNALRVPFKGYSLRSFYEAAKLLPHYEYLCFLNSHSIILEDNWLDKLMFGMTLPNAGISGTTASQETFPHNILWPSFPNPHIRTNAFIIRRDLMLKVWARHLNYKWQEHLFESGRNGLTRRINRLGLKAYVIGKNGYAYDETQFSFANVFRQGIQSNLLVADNQTRHFACAPEVEQKVLTLKAHGLPTNT